MRLTVVDTPRRIGQTPGGGRWVTFHVLSGTLYLSDDEQSLHDGGGLPLETHDGLHQLFWYGPLWVMAASGTTADIVFVIPG